MFILLYTPVSPSRKTTLSQHLKMKDEIGCIKSLDKLNRNDSEIVFVNMATKEEKVLIHKNQGAEESCLSIHIFQRTNLTEKIPIIKIMFSKF